jgi:DnaK suppressor protein
MGQMPEVRGATFARKALLARKRRLVALAARLRHEDDESQSGRRPGNFDRAADLEVYDVLENLHAAETRELAEIEAALQRLELGTYGQCERCGVFISMLRLRAVPDARLCMGCSGRR